MPSDTFFTEAPHWEWLVVLYFFVGGIAGGAYFLAALLDLFGTPEDRPTARLGYYVALPAITFGGILLIVDLDRPERFWHMMIESKTGEPMFKWWSPISFGVWGITLFGLCAFLSVVGVLAETGRLPAGLSVLHSGTLGQAISAIGAIFGLFVAGYTGILLAATNRPLWADTDLLGLLFVVSGVSAAVAVLLLIGWRRAHPGSLDWLSRMSFFTDLLELAILLFVAISIWSLLDDLWGNGWGVLLVVGVVLVGLLAPLVLHWRPRLLGSMSVPSAAALVLIGGFILRVVVVLSSEAV